MKNNSSLEKGLLSLPIEVWDIIFIYLRSNNGSFMNLLAFALAHQRTLDVVLSCTTASKLNVMDIEWNDLPLILRSSKDDNSKLLQSAMVQIHEIRIIKSHGPSQWVLAPDLARLISICPNLNKLEVLMEGGSGWIKELAPALKSVNTFVAQSNRGRDSMHNMFQIEHLVLPMKDCLRTLELHGFNLVGHEGYGFRGMFSGDDTPDTPAEYDQCAAGAPMLPKLCTLILKDCIWEYPFQLDGIAAMTVLKVSYSKGNQYFLDSERFRQLLKEPPASVRTLVIESYSTKFFSDRIALAEKVARVDLAYREKHKEALSTEVPPDLAPSLLQLFPGNIDVFELVLTNEDDENCNYKTTANRQVLLNYKHKQFVLTTESTS